MQMSNKIGSGFQLSFIGFAGFTSLFRMSFDTFGGVLLRFTQDASKDTERKRSETSPFRAAKEYAALSINPKQTPTF
jgi:hypothetical protein